MPKGRVQGSLTEHVCLISGETFHALLSLDCCGLQSAQRRLRGTDTYTEREQIVRMLHKRSVRQWIALFRICFALFALLFVQRIDLLCSSGSGLIVA